MRQVEIEDVDLRPYQRSAIEHALEWTREAKPGDKILYASPTGSGKSLIELMIQSVLKNCWIVTPKIEIVRDMLGKLGLDVDELSESDIRFEGFKKRIVTPITLRNVMRKGTLERFGFLIVDECHHDTADSYQELHAMTGFCPALGFTATPYRGTPRTTKTLLEHWGEPVWIISYPEAQAEGWISIPSCVCWPLVDDDQIEIVNGELVANQIVAATEDKLEALLPRLRFDIIKPTMISLPSRELAKKLQSICSERGVSSVLVTGETSYKDRQEAFRKTLACEAILIQIEVVTEGNDLRIERLIDLSPTLSPVRFLQRIGRIMRPELHPEYICCNRNLERHGYLLDGCIPASYISDAQKVFPIPSSRMCVRALGLESVGKLKPTYLTTLSGLTIAVYAISQVVDNRVVQYCAIVHPAEAGIMWSTKHNTREDGVTAKYGQWTRCEPPTMLEGFASMKAGTISEKQTEWYRRQAQSLGLNPEVLPDGKEFQAFAVLASLKLRIL